MRNFLVLLESFCSQLKGSTEPAVFSAELKTRPKTSFNSIAANSALGTAGIFSTMKSAIELLKAASALNSIGPKMSSRTFSRALLIESLFATLILNDRKMRPL